MKNADVSNLTWCNAGSKVVDLSEIIEFVDKNKKLAEIHVGCDSHYIKDRCVFAVVVAIYEPRKGGTYFFARKKVDRKRIGANK